MDDVQKRAVRDRILRDIAAEQINPGCNKRQIEAGIDAVANYRSVATNRKVMDDLFDPAVPAEMRARIFTAVFAVEEAEAKEQRRLAVKEVSGGTKL